MASPDNVTPHKFSLGLFHAARPRTSHFHFAHFLSSFSTCPPHPDRLDRLIWGGFESLVAAVTGERPSHPQECRTIPKNRSRTPSSISSRRVAANFTKPLKDTLSAPLTNIAIVINWKQPACSVSAGTSCAHACNNAENLGERDEAGVRSQEGRVRLRANRDFSGFLNRVRYQTQPAFNRQRSKIENEHDNEHEHD